MLKLTGLQLKLTVLCIAMVVALCGLLAFNTLKAPLNDGTQFDAKQVLTTLNTTDDVSDFLEIEQMIKTVMEQYGTKAGFELIDEGERQHIISNDACHGLLHYVGHAAYAENPTDFRALLSVVEGTNCIGGYLHGIEAEIVLTSANVVGDVQNFCQFQKDEGVNPGACYHGVGHAATELYDYDIPKSLALCDALKDEVESDLTNCYRGVFSEVGNIVTGYDGHTGLSIDTIAIAGLDVTKPFAFCESFADKYQSSCKSQLVKVATMNTDFEDWYNACLDPALAQSSVAICVNIVSGVYVRHHLSFADSTALPKDINLFKEELQRVAILGSAEAFAGYFYDNTPKDWESFCATFVNKKTQTYCVDTFTDILQNNTTPWMERTDIR